MSQVIGLAASWLQRHDVVDPEPSATELLAKATGFRSPREMFQERPASTTAELTAEEWIVFRELCWKRAVEHVPVQYLVGEWDFHKINLEMEPPTLIPRPETEELVDLILDWLRAEGWIGPDGNTQTSDQRSTGSSRGLRFLDVGSGTGAIGLALLNKLPGATCVAIDKQDAAVQLSRRNAERTGLRERYRCFHTDIAGFAATMASGKGGTGASTGMDVYDSFDFVVSNPPYIPRRDMTDLPPDVAEHEDATALDGGRDGLDVIRDIVRECPRLLRREGCRRLWMEVDTSHPESMASWLGLKGGREYGEQSPEGLHGVTAFEWRRDLSQRPRFVELTFSRPDPGPARVSSPA